jgi:hypothetical protein
MPPSIVRQVPPKPTQSSSSNGSILSTAVPVRQLAEVGRKVCLYGRNRVGKTTLACQFPKPLLLVSCEPAEAGGAESVAKMDGVHLIRIANRPLPGEKLYGKTKALALAEELGRGHQFKTVVLDTATSLQDLILQEIMGLSKVPEQLDWGSVNEDQYRDRSSQTKEALRPYLDLKCHVVVCAQEKDHNPPKDRSTSKLTRSLQTESFFAADLGGATAKWLQDACSCIVQLYEDWEIKEIVNKAKVGDQWHETREVVETGKRVRRLRTLFHVNYMAGIRSATPEAVPEFLQCASPNEFYVELVKVLEGIKSSKGKY